MSNSQTLTLAEANDRQLGLAFVEWLRYKVELDEPIPRREIVQLLEADGIAGVQYWAPDDVTDETASPVTDEDMPVRPVPSDDGRKVADGMPDDDEEFEDLPAASLDSTWSAADIDAYNIETFYVTVLLELARVSKGFIHTAERTVRESADLGSVITNDGIGWTCGLKLSAADELECRKIIIAALDVFPYLQPLFGLRVRHVRNVLFDVQRLVLEWRPSVSSTEDTELDEFIDELNERTDLVWQVD